MSDEKRVSVTVIKAFRDRYSGFNWKTPGFVFETTKERAEKLAEQGWVSLPESGNEKLAEKVNQAPTEKNKDAGPNTRKKAK